MSLPPSSTRAGGVPLPVWVWLAGVVAALHIGKLPPAMPLLQSALGMTWVQVGFLLSTVQVAGMATGVLMGAWIPYWGLRRSVLVGLCLMGGAGWLGSWATTPAVLMGLRAVEGLGVLLTVVSAPALMRQLVPAGQLGGWMGLWGAYMPTGAALAMVVGPGVLNRSGWSGWWQGLATLALLLAVWCSRILPKAMDPAAASTPNGIGGRFAAVGADLRLTLSHLGPWCVALCFALYSSQWLAVVGFLPTVYALAGLDAVQAGWMTAAVTAANIAGNVSAGRWLQRGVPPTTLMGVAFLTMGCMAAVAFGAWTDGWPWLRYAAVGLFSAVGGLLPGTLFALAVRVAPHDRTVSTTVGWMQQCSSAGQFAGPPLVAWLAVQMGGWSMTWVATGAASALGLVLVAVLHRLVLSKSRAFAA